MGQATVDLPDPSEVPAAPMSSADDLLAQMAGEEIDRLLAEADVEKGSKDPAAPTSETPEAPPAAEVPLPALSGTDPQLDAVLDQAASTPVPRTDEADSIQAALFDDAKPVPVHTRSLMPGAVIEPEPIEAPDLKAEAKQLDEALAKGSTEALPEIKNAEVETSTLEKNALTDAIESIDPHAQPAPELKLDDAPVPFYLKPLVWINFPMDFLPPPAREAIGKVALLTLVNSIGILAYVLVFRKHH